MIILSILRENSIQPIAIVDYTRSNEQWTTEEINKYANQISVDYVVRTNLSGAVIKSPLVYSLDYKMAYEHRGISVGDSIKTNFYAEINNAPNEVVDILRIKEVVSSQNIEILGDSLSRVANSEVVFPSGGFVVRSGGVTVFRPFTIFSTPFEPDRFRINNKLILRGGSYEDLVLRLNVSANIDKSVNLSTQIDELLTKTPYKASYNFEPDKKPAISKYYSPAPINEILENISIDNKITFKLEDNAYEFLSLDPNNPPASIFKNKFTFFNSIANTKLIGNVTFSNYAIANIECELYDPSLYETILVYDDSNINPDSDALSIFFNLNKVSQEERTVGGRKISAYPFYVIGYTIEESRELTLVSVIGSNNWLLSNIKIDALFEPAIFRELLNG